MEREGRRVDDQREKLSWNAAHLQPAPPHGELRSSPDWIEMPRS